MPDGTSPAFFRIEGDVFIGNDAARGPWSPHACHAGPVTGVIAHAMEPLSPEQQLVRLSISFVRPVPVAGFRIETESVREGRAASTSTARLFTLDGKLCAKAKSLRLSTCETTVLPTASLAGPAFDDAVPGPWILERAPHGQTHFGEHVDIRLPPGEDTKPGPTTLWMRTIPIIEDEPQTPFQTLCPLADCGNGISRNIEMTDYSCVNPDLTLVAFRQPQSDWLASQAMSFWEPNGIGMSHAMLFDKKGAVGTALQTLLLRPID